jgi:hypothetical protein
VKTLALIALTASLLQPALAGVDRLPPTTKGTEVLEPASVGQEKLAEWRMVPVLHAEFVVGAGEADYVTHQIGSTGWHDRMSSTRGMPAEFLPKIEADRQARKVAAVRWLPEMDSSFPEQGSQAYARAHAWLWKAVRNVRLQPFKNYQLAVEIDAGENFTEESWRLRGLGLGLTSSPTDLVTGNFIADTLSQPKLLKIENLQGTRQRLTMTYRTGAEPSKEEIGVIIFNIRYARRVEITGRQMPPTVESANSSSGGDQWRGDFNTPNFPAGGGAGFPTSTPITSTPTNPPTPNNRTLPRMVVFPPLETPPGPPTPTNVVARKVVVEALPEPTTGVLILCSIPLYGLRRFRSQFKSNPQS